MAIKPILFNTISIHAPTRGATITGAVLCLLNRYFNPRSYKRSDSALELALICDDDFNPRSYKRSDLPLNISVFVSIISIHAPTRGATCVGNQLPCAIHISIHAPTRGATSADAKSSNDFPRFQSTLLQEERRNAITH